MLMRRWERARKGDGQLVLIVGEPGLGKSRLVEELHLRDTPHTWTEWSCSQLLQNTPLHPIAEWGRRRFGGTETAAEQQLADLENTLALIKIDPAENVPFLAPLLDIPLPKERLSDFAPEEFRRRQLAAMTNWVVAGARNQPVVLALEDVYTRLHSGHRRTRGAGALTASHHRPTRIPAALGYALASRHHLSCPT
jgi:predicted ATPase